MKKSLKEYQKRLSLLENASFDNRKSVCRNYQNKAKDDSFFVQVKKTNILTTGSGKVVIAAVLM